MSLFVKRALAAAVAVVFAVSCVTNPVTGKSELSLLSVEEEKEMGRKYYGPMIQQSNGKVNDPELQAFTQGVGLELARASHSPEHEYQFTVVNASYDNAFALPGGKICITRGLLSRMTNEDQLAGVLGHETGHVTARHGAAGMTRAMLAQGVLGIGGAVLEAKEVRGGALILAAAGVGAQLVLQRYSRDQERQSDELGMQYMVKAGYTPRGFVQSMEILKGAHDKEPSKLEAMFQSHPLTSERIETARQRAAQLYPEASGRELKTRRFAEATSRMKAEAPAFRLADEAEKAMAAKDNRLAADKLAEASRLAPRQAILPALQALALLRMNDTASALRVARDAQRLDPTLYQASLVAGVAQYQQKQWDGAIKDLDAAEDAVGPQLVTSYLIGRSHEAVGRKEKAAERYAFVVKNAQQRSEDVDYCARRLTEWGYLQPQPQPQPQPQ